MFYFIDFSKDKVSEKQDKGKLFEELIGKIIEKLGYKDIQIRIKQSSLEYDILATSKLGNKKLIGEAKAYNKKIDCDTMATFIGRMHPEWQEDPQAVGIFISIFDLTPDAKDYQSRIQKTDNLTTIIGNQIIEHLVKDMDYQNMNQIQDRSRRLYTQLRPGKVDLLISDRGDYFLQLLIPTGETLPTCFAIFKHDGEPIDEISFADEIKGRIKEFF